MIYKIIASEFERVAMIVSDPPSALTFGTWAVI